MIPRKKKKKLIIAIIITIILVTIGILIFLYMKTDAFKSNDNLFAKYLVQNFSIIEELQSTNGMKEASQLLQNNKYTSTIEGKINYISNKGLEEEKTDNIINDIELRIEGQTDKISKYDYKDIKIMKQNENLARTEYINTDDRYGIRLDGIKQFVSTENQEFINDQEKSIVTFIKNWNQINWDEIREIFTHEELNTLKNKYINIIMKNISKQSFSKQANTVITINEASIRTNAYAITLNKEQFNNIYIQILETAKQDEIILNKLDELNMQIKTFTNITQDIKQDYINNITNKIDEIKSKNIGQEKRKVTVFEKNGQTIRTQIETDEYQFQIDRLTNQNGIWIEMYYQKESEKENSWKINTMITATENEEEDYYNITLVKDGVANNIELNGSQKMQNNDIQSKWEMKAYNEKNELTLIIEKKDTIVNNFSEKIELTKENNINIEALNDESKKNITQIINENLQKQLDKLQETVSLQDVMDVLVNVNLIKPSTAQLTDSGIITEAEKNRFNAMFEFYQGEDLEIENIKKMMGVVKENLKEIKIMEYKEKNSSSKQDEPKTYLIVIQKDNKNEDLANLLLENLENNKKTEKYSVKIEYNETTGLIEHIILSIQK